MINEAIETFFNARNIYYNDKKITAWVSLLKEKMNDDDIIETCKYLCYNIQEKNIGIPDFLEYNKTRKQPATYQGAGGKDEPIQYEDGTREMINKFKRGAK